MILIYPPAVRICEPPGGVAYLSGALKHHGVKCTVIDANLDALLWLGYTHSQSDNSDKIKCRTMAFLQHDSHDLQNPHNLQNSHDSQNSYNSHAKYHLPGHHKTHSLSKHQADECKPVPRENDRWTKRAINHFQQNLSDLKDPCLYTNMERYRQKVFEVNRAIGSFLPERFRISLSDYHDSLLSPVKSCDLISSFKNFNENPFYQYFENFLFKKIATSLEDGAIEKIDKQSGDYVGISLCYLSQALTGFALAGWIKSKFPKKKIIMGGGLVTSWMSSPDWKNPFDSIIDIMVKGQGEKILLEISGKRMGKKEHFLPDFDFASWDSYLSPGRILPYRASTGCYWNKCRFCPERAEKSHYFSEKTEDVLDDLQSLSKRYRIDTVHFLDNSLSYALLKAISKRKMPFVWYGFARFMKELANYDFSRALYSSGCRMLKLGLESGDQTVLDYMHKGTDLAVVSDVLASLKKAGLATYVYLLFGTLQETEESAEKTLFYVADHSHEINFINTAIFNLPRFSEDAMALETDKFYEGDLSLYLNFTHPKGWDRKNIRHFLSKRFKKNPMISPAIRNTPPFFTSNHAVFFAKKK